MRRNARRGGRTGGAGRAVEFPRHSARVNRRVRTLRLARSAIDAFARDRRRHLVTGPQLNDVGEKT